MTTKQIVEANPTASLDELVALCKNKVSREYIRKLRVKLGLPPLRVTSQNKALTTEQEVEKDLTVRTLKDKREKTDRKYQALLAQNEVLQKVIEASHQTKEVQFHQIKKSDLMGSEATAVVLASDWHSEETVKASSVNGLNEFNLEVFNRRADFFFANTAKLIESKQKVIRVQNLVLALLGDFITGNIHEEGVETASLLPVEALINVQNKIASGIQYLLDTTNVDLIIPCHSGNHARFVKKPRNATEAGHSLEYVMYHNLANVFKDRRVKFIISPSYHSYLDINGFTIRFHHGHDIRYAGGIGGLTIPALKAIANWNTIKVADLDCWGHFHQQFFGGTFICNGSLIGFNAYAVAIKARFEKPRQAFFLVNHDRKEVTDYSPVWLD
jgi:hypothetical protein